MLNWELKEPLLYFNVLRYLGIQGSWCKCAMPFSTQTAAKTTNAPIMAAGTMSPSLGLHGLHVSAWAACVCMCLHVSACVCMGTHLKQIGKLRGMLTLHSMTAYNHNVAHNQPPSSGYHMLHLCIAPTATLVLFWDTPRDPVGGVRIEGCRQNSQELAFVLQLVHVPLG